jgi:DNA-3-methyladenine glycosylase II
VSSRRPNILTSERHIAAGAAELALKCRIMRAIHAKNGTPPLRHFSPGFAGLAQIVTGQQLSTASAAAIWSRVAAALSPCDASALAATPDQALAALGLSRGKIRTLKALAEAVTSGALDMTALAAAPDKTVIERLTAIHGIGPWTADIFLLFALRRADAFPPGDLALQLAAQRLFKLKDKPAAAELTAIAERWRPWRGVAAHLLWADYGAMRGAARKKPLRPTRPKTKIKR